MNESIVYVDDEPEGSTALYGVTIAGVVVWFDSHDFERLCDLLDSVEARSSAEELRRKVADRDLVSWRYMTPVAPGPPQPPAYLGAQDTTDLVARVEKLERTINRIAQAVGS